MGEFGDKFRKAREKKELSLDDVSNVTKISARMLQAIEQEHFDLLPGGVFNKGFIRAYAKHLGIDPEDAVTDYLATLRQAQIDAHEVWEPQPPVPARAPAVKPKVHSVGTQSVETKKPDPQPEKPVQVDELPQLQLPRIEDVRPSRKEFLFRQDSGTPRIVIAAALVVVALSAFLWTRHSRSTRAASSAQASSQPAALATPQPAAATVAAPLNNANPSTPGSKATSTPAAQAASATPSPTTAVPPPKEDGGSDVTVRTFGKPDTKPAAKAAANTLSLIIRAEQTSWVSVQADGRLVTEETLIAPAYYSVHASREIIVRVGNAAGVNFIFNGKDVLAQGGESEARTLVFDSSGMKTSSPP